MATSREHIREVPVAEDRAQVVGSVMPTGAALRAIGGVGTLVVAALFAYQLHRVLNALPGGKLGDVLDSGLYFAAIGAVIGLIGASHASVADFA
jgi:hypothetical protein